MLKGIDHRLNADVLGTLRAMGHGDYLIVSDTNFPADSIAQQTTLGYLLRMENLTAAEAINAILSVLPLDTFVDDFAGRMQVGDDPDDVPPKYNAKRFELLPLAYIRGMNIENAVVIIDEMQNMSRSECRSLLSRMGEGVKCICLGDIHQVDNPYLNRDNNGMNWVVNKFKGSKIYAHLVLKGDKSRGPITDLVIRSGL